MESVAITIQFFERIKGDPKISPSHISLFMALVQWHIVHAERPLYFFAKDIMPFAKIASDTTFHKAIKDLHDFGYINYVPSFSPFLGNMVEFT